MFRQKEKLVAIPIIEHNGKRSVTLEVQKRQSLHSDLGKDSKTVVDGIVKNGRRKKKVSVVARRSENIRASAEGWAIGKEAHLPVPDFLRFSPNSNELITPNLKANGGEFYGKGLLYQLLTFDGKAKRSFQPCDVFFLQLMREQEDKLIDTVLQLVFDATKNGVNLPSDDAFELYISPKGEWCLRILDTEKMMKSRKTRIILLDENTSFAGITLGRLRALTEFIAKDYQEKKPVHNILFEKVKHIFRAN